MTRYRNILITGGAGFIGSGLARRLLDAGAAITIVDNLATGFERNVPKGATFILGDVGDAELMRGVFERGRFDAVLHMSAQVSNIISHKDPWLDFKTNVGGTINVLEEVRRHKIGRLMYASSMALYGTPKEIPVTETAPLQPLSPYGVSKMAAELLVHNTAKRNDLGFQLGVTSMRMFNVYGPGQSLENPYQGVVSVFISNLLRNEPITLYGDGKQSRDFVFIGDILDGWIAALDNEKSYGERINLGSGQEATINDLIDSVLAAFGKDRTTHQVIQKPELPGDQRHVRADVSKAGALLGWKPKARLSDGLREAIAWGRAHWNVVASSR